MVSGTIVSWGLAACPRHTTFSLHPISWSHVLATINTLILSLNTILDPSLQPPGTTELHPSPWFSGFWGMSSEPFFLGREAASRLCRGQWLPLLLLPEPLQE